jgi:hypothetical protein
MVESANTYEGEFENDRKHGKGTFIWGASGNKYEGNFKDDNRHGFGIYTWLDGIKYIGYWEDDKMHGQGKMVYPEGDKQVGMYEKGKFKGKIYKPIDKKRQLFRLLKNIKLHHKSKSILAVGGDHLLFNSTESKGRKSKLVKKRINYSLDYDNTIDYSDLQAIRNINSRVSSRWIRVNNGRLHSASGFYINPKDIKKSIIDADPSTLESSNIDRRPRSRDWTSSNPNKYTLTLNITEEEKIMRRNSKKQKTLKEKLMIEDLSSKMAENLQKIINQKSRWCSTHKWRKPFIINTQNNSEAEIKMNSSHNFENSPFVQRSLLQNLKKSFEAPYKNDNSKIYSINNPRTQASLNNCSLSNEITQCLRLSIPAPISQIGSEDTMQVFT